MVSGGYILNIGSLSTEAKEAGSEAYVATKAGIRAFSDSLRKSLNPKGIRLTLIEPGSVDTDMQPQSSQEKAKSVSQDQMLTSQHIAKTVLFCLHQDAGVEIMQLQIKPTRQII